MAADWLREQLAIKMTCYRAYFSSKNTSHHAHYREKSTFLQKMKPDFFDM